MLIKLLKYSILGLFILNIPMVVLVHMNAVFSSLLSYGSFLMLLAYYILAPKTQMNHWMILIGLLYFSISTLSGQTYLPETNRDFYVYMAKYFIVAIAGYELIKNVSNREMLIFLAIGAFSIVFQILYFYDPLRDSGRYSGFYLNPNGMGFICLMGYALTFSLGKSKWKLPAQILFTIMGLVTFSRTFMVLWILVNLISLKYSVKNVRVFVLGFFLLLAVITYNEILPVKNPRIEQISALISGESLSSSGLGEDSRTDTWSNYYGAVSQKPFLGHGFDSFRGHTQWGVVGPHNTYLKIIGEAGIIVLVVFLLFMLSTLRKSWDCFHRQPHLFMMSLAFVLYLATNHNYFDTGYMLFMIMWLYHNSKEYSLQDPDEDLAIADHAKMESGN